MKNYDFVNAINNIINDINIACIRAKQIHSASNIDESGREVESIIREKISLFLPEKYLVKQGQIIDHLGNVSNQFDIIIFDRLSTPKFFESMNGSVYYPIETVLAVGEIKKTLKPNHSVEFANKLIHLRNDMTSCLVENTAYNQVDNMSDVRDILSFSQDQKYKNPLFTFIFAVDGNIDKINSVRPVQYFANDIVVLNSGYLTTGTFKNNIIKPLAFDDAETIDNLFVIKSESSDILSRFLDRLITHLNKCQVSPLNITKYITKGEVLKAHTDNLTIKKFE